MSSCSHCGGELPAQATFCPSCGRRADLPPSDPRNVPLDVQHAEPRYFGLGPPIFVFVVSVVLFFAGVVLLVLGQVGVGALAVVLSLCLLPAFLAGARRWPDTSIARVGVSTADRVRDEADVAATSISTWSRAGRDLVRLRKEQYRLRRERDDAIRRLGVSVFEGDGRADELLEQARELDRQLTLNEQAATRTIAGARRRTRKERAAVVSTEVIRPGEADEAEAQAGSR